MVRWELEGYLKALEETLRGMEAAKEGIDALKVCIHWVSIGRSKTMSDGLVGRASPKQLPCYQVVQLSNTVIGGLAGKASV